MLIFQQNAQLAYELKEAELNAIFLKELNDAQEIIKQEELEQQFKDMCNQNKIDEGYGQYECNFTLDFFIYYFALKQAFI